MTHKVSRAASGASSTTATSWDLGFDFAVPIGEKLIGAFALNPFPATSLPTMVITDTKSNVYTVRQSIADSAFNETIYIFDSTLAHAVTATDSMHFTTVGALSIARWGAVVDRFTDMGAYDTGTTHSGNASSGMSSGAVTATTGQVAVGAFSFATSHLPYTQDAGWTLEPPVSAGTTLNAADRAVCLQYLENALGSVNPGGTNADTAGIYAGAVALYDTLAQDTGIWGVDGGVLVPFDTHSVISGVLS